MLVRLNIFLSRESHNISSPNKMGKFGVSLKTAHLLRNASHATRRFRNWASKNTRAVFFRFPELIRWSPG